ncbi:hypothetical protein BG004_003939 [Podila humilis]|nr:hypothetical protein BG004_003939 [Podila humilis]
MALYFNLPTALLKHSKRSIFRSKSLHKIMYSSKLSAVATFAILALVTQANPVPSTDGAASASASTPALVKRGFGCPWDAYQCSTYCTGIGRNGGHCGGFLRMTCICNQS